MEKNVHSGKKRKCQANSSEKARLPQKRKDLKPSMPNTRWGSKGLRHEDNIKPSSSLQTVLPTWGTISLLTFQSPEGHFIPLPHARRSSGLLSQRPITMSVQDSAARSRLTCRALCSASLKASLTPPPPPPPPPPPAEPEEGGGTVE